MTPAREIGGDFYDCFKIDEFRLSVIIADVPGKGVPAALLTLVSRDLLKAVARNHDSPAQCLGEVNELVSQHNDVMMFVTLFYFVLDLRNGSFRYCNGGIIYRCWHEVPTTGQPNCRIPEHGPGNHQRP